VLAELTAPERWDALFPQDMWDADTLCRSSSSMSSRSTGGISSGSRVDIRKNKNGEKRREDEMRREEKRDERKRDGRVRKRVSESE
jgi:hypothetical protein